MNFEAQRRQMVSDQLLARGIRDPRVLAAFSRVPRNLFVPEDYRDVSYTDRPLPIGEGQTISQPYIAALMTEWLAPAAGARVLEIGTGCGYQTAILAELDARVYSIERIPELADRTERLLSSLGYSHVKIRVGDGSLGWPEQAPFDGILVTAAAPAFPRPLLDQLAVNGRLLIPIESDVRQTLTLAERSSSGFVRKEICSCLFVPLIGAHGWQEGHAAPEE